MFTMGKVKFPTSQSPQVRRWVYRIVTWMVQEDKKEQEFKMPERVEFD